MDGKRWSKEVTTDKGSKRISVEQVENGFIITKSIDTYGDSTIPSKYETKKYISKENPIKNYKGFEELNDEVHPTKLYEGIE